MSKAPQTQRKIALVTHTTEGGIGTVTRFLQGCLERDKRYLAEVVLLATSAKDPDSVALLNPASWVRRPRISRQDREDHQYWKSGAIIAELEFQRYKPTAALTRFLSTFDLIQAVSGTPAWAAATAKVARPVCLFVATMTQQERVSLVRDAMGWRRLYWPIMNRIVTQIERRALAHVDYVFAESTYTWKLLAPFVPTERLGLGVPGVDTALFCPAYSPHPGYILSVGRFDDRRKNVRLAFEAYHLLIQQHPNAPALLLAGSTPPLKQDLQYAMCLGLNDRLIIKTNPSEAELVKLYQGASLLLLSSDEEGLGMVILEAMACGLPVVSTDCGGPSTAVVEGETGFLTPVGDGPALAQATAKLIDDHSLRERMGRAGRRRAEQVFSLQAAGGVFLRKYDELLNNVRH